MRAVNEGTKGDNMKNATHAAVISLIALGAALVAPPVKADTWDKLTKVTFSGPVEIPGQVLPGGTYWFKLLSSPSSRNIVQIYTEDKSKQLAMIMAVPDYRLKPSSKVVITFDERPAGSPPAIKAWFYPGDNYGQEFVYPKTRAVTLAKESHQPVPAMPENLEPNTHMPAKSVQEAPAMALKQAPVKEEEPNGQEVEITEVITTPPELLAQNTAPAQPAAQPAAELPRTASSVPMVALLGLILVSAGFLVRFAAKSIS
jgi:hypothetical protein